MGGRLRGGFMVVTGEKISSPEAGESTYLPRVGVAERRSNSPLFSRNSYSIFCD